jgi:hypothetical protein
MIKSVDVSGNWNILDNKRTEYNVMGEVLYADTNAAKDDGTYLDLLSNGFKLRLASDYWNNNTMLYLAFAESPFKYSNAR